MLRFSDLRFGARQVELRASVIKYRPLSSPPAYFPDPADSHEVARHIDPRDPMEFWSGFRELPKGFPLTLQTEAVPPR
jgi:hypothetical protein